MPPPPPAANLVSGMPAQPLTRSDGSRSVRRDRKPGAGTDDVSLNGKRAAITGAASGIGLECARMLLDAGATVALVDRNEPLLMELAEEFGEKAHPVVTDLLEPASVSRMMPQILERLGGLDIFHANAGAYVGGDVSEGDPDVWDKVLNLNINAHSALFVPFFPT